MRACALAALLVAAGCHVKTTTKVPAAEIRPLLEASEADLLSRYEALSRSVRTVNAKVELAPHTGSRYSGVIEDYHKVDGFILASSPSHIRMIGKAPVAGTTVFDMVSDGEMFRISIPPKGKFIVGPARFERPSKKPLENLRPQHVLDAIFWPPLPEDHMRLFAEEQEGAARYYTLTLVRRGEKPEIERRLWFDRADLSLSRLELFEPGGLLVSIIHYSGWQAEADGTRFPREINLERPRNDYRLDTHILTLTLNAEIAADRFHLEQPPGSELVRVGENPPDAPGSTPP
jgi:outer membrane lipoprotein-sorting protein